MKKELDYSVIDDKVMVNSLIIPVILFGIAGIWYAIAYMIFTFLVYMFGIRWFDITDEVKKYKQISYLRVILYFYLPATIFLFALMLKI